MRAGQLRHRLAWDRAAPTRSASGAEVPGWLPAGTVWASIEPLRGREILGSDRIVAEMDTRIRIRWSPAVDSMTARDRLRIGATKYDIVSVAHVALRRREIELMCKSGSNEG